MSSPPTRRRSAVLPAPGLFGSGPAEPFRDTSAASSILSRAIVLKLICVAAGGALVTEIEIGAVGPALDFCYQLGLAVLFTVLLCLASVSGRLWISMRNRLSNRRAIVVQLALLSMGITLILIGGTLTTTILGAVIVGLMLAPLGTHYALVLDKLAPPNRRSLVFALLRTSNALGIIFTSALLTSCRCTPRCTWSRLRRLRRRLRRRSSGRFWGGPQSLTEPFTTP